jgi:hypothetical protein
MHLQLQVREAFEFVILLTKSILFEIEIDIIDYVLFVNT